MTNKNNQLKIFILSDTVGDISEKVIFAVLSQFPNVKEQEIKKYPFLDNISDLTSVLNDAKNEQAVVVSTLINHELSEAAKDYTDANNLFFVDYLYPLMKVLSNKLDEKPIYQSSALHALNEQYFDRISAIEFAVKYDDGKNPRGFLKSDIVLLGISRTSKTPLSMYLANHSYKVSNLPLIPEVEVAPEIFEVPSEKIFGLVASPEYIMNVRSERVKMMGLASESTYNNMQRIKQELSYAEELYDKLGATVINMENRSIEETAQQIELRLAENYRNLS